jgi:hypothetical protein
MASAGSSRAGPGRLPGPSHVAAEPGALNGFLAPLIPGWPYISDYIVLTMRPGPPPP